MASANLPAFSITREVDDLTSGLMEQQKNGAHTDFIIIAGCKEIKCHSSVLIATCPFFSALFNAKMKEVTEKKVELNGFEPRLLEKVIIYLYSGEMKIQAEDMQEVMGICDHLLLSKTKDQCVELVCDKMDASNCIGWFTFADTYNLNDIKVKSRETILDELSAVTDSHDFRQMSKADLVDIINEKTQLDDHHDVPLRAITHWVLANSEDRRDRFEGLLEHIKLEKCSKEYLKHILINHEDQLLTSIKVYRMLTRALLHRVKSKDCTEAETNAVAVSLPPSTNAVAVSLPPSTTAPTTYGQQTAPQGSIYGTKVSAAGFCFEKKSSKKSKY